MKKTITTLILAFQCINILADIKNCPAPHTSFEKNHSNCISGNDKIWENDYILLRGVNGYGAIRYSETKGTVAYICSNDPEGMYEDVTIEYEINGEKNTEICLSYPFEFEIPLDETSEYISFRLIAYKDCNEFISNNAILEKKSSISTSMQKEQTVVYPGEKAVISFFLTGNAPWNLKYQIGEKIYNRTKITSNPFKEIISIDNNTAVYPISINDANFNGSVTGHTNIYLATDSIQPYYNTYVQENYPENNFSTWTILDLKTGGGWSREIFLSFNLSKLNTINNKFIFRIYLSHIDKLNILRTELSGNTLSYDKQLSWNNKDNNSFTPIDTVSIYAFDLNQYIEWDVTDWVKTHIKNGDKQITFRLKNIEGGDALCRFYSLEWPEYSLRPSILAVSDTNIYTSTETYRMSEYIKIYPNPFSDDITLDTKQYLSSVSIYSLEGKCYLYKTNLAEGIHTLELNRLPPSIYFIELISTNKKINKKIIKTN